MRDFLEHDPRYSGPKGCNLLTDPAPLFKGQQLPARRLEHECKHSLLIKPAQSIVHVSEDEQPDTSTRYNVSSYCQQCRYHFNVAVDFTDTTRGQQPCKLSDKDNPMHHLRLLRSWNIKEHKDEPFDKYNPVIESYQFVCSASKCPVTVEFTISAPRLPKTRLKSLIDAEALESRGKRVIAGEPERYVGLEPLLPIQVFSNLRQYLQDAQASSRVPGDVKRIARRNKKYFLAFADECNDLFDYLDFHPKTENGETEVSDCFCL